MNHMKPSPSRCRSHNAGFTLVEMAVVVTLIGILMALGLATATSVMESSQRATTKDRQDYVRDAFLAYFTVNHRFPCPDNGSNVGNTGRDGVEDRTAGGATPTVTVGCTTALGTVPYQTLGIAREKALDAYGNFITYRLDTARNWHLTATFQAPPGTPRAPCSPAGIIAPPVLGLSVFSTPAIAQITSAAVVLVSHGANGAGAWNQGTTNASRNALPTTTPEQGNTALNPATPAGYRSYVYSDAAATPFDDVVQFFSLGDLQVLMVTKMGRANICS
jgi:prepilin-type N-terminal cleavage/methylation domain-containing protein